MVEEEATHPEADLEEVEAGTAQRKEMEEGIETDPTKPKEKKLNIIHTHMEAPILLQKQQLQKQFSRRYKWTTGKETLWSSL